MYFKTWIPELLAIATDLRFFKTMNQCHQVQIKNNTFLGHSTTIKAIILNFRIIAIILPYIILFIKLSLKKTKINYKCFVL